MFIWRLETGPSWAVGRLMAGLLVAGTLLAGAQVLAADEYASHPPMRPLHHHDDSRLIIVPDGQPRYFVSQQHGSDANDGSAAKPWATINHAIRQLKPGDTLLIREGVYYEQLVVPVSGEADRPINIRADGGNLVIIDGGLREFAESPSTSWEPFAGDDAAPGEYVSTKTYPQFSSRLIVHHFPEAAWEPFYSQENNRPLVQGNFADSMVPLHPYRTAADMRDSSTLWDVDNKSDETQSVYCGPGLWFNRATERIHIRLAHTDLPHAGDVNYKGETDPRKLRLIISSPIGSDVLRLNGVKHVNIQHLVFRGGAGSALVNIYGCEDIAFERCTFYGGAPSMMINATANLKVTNSAFRGLSAPWSSRASMKYRGTPAYMIITHRASPLNRDMEFANCEFTDSHDFFWMRYVDNLKFHHNYVDNMNDDCLEVGARLEGQSTYIYQNYISRSLLNLTLHEITKQDSPKERTEGGVYVTRNVFDLRHGSFKFPPKTLADAPDNAYLHRDLALAGDHGSPDWPNYFFYHNTVLRPGTNWRGYYGAGIGGQGINERTIRRVLNNIFVQNDGLPGLKFHSDAADLLVDGNIHWGLSDGPAYEKNFFEAEWGGYGFRNKPMPEAWMKRDQFADPKFRQLTTNAYEDFNLHLTESSPAIDSGAAVPSEWIDPLRDEDKGEPDIGALPAGAKAWQIGVYGRLPLFAGPGR